MTDGNKTKPRHIHRRGANKIGAVAGGQQSTSTPNDKKTEFTSSASVDEKTAEGPSSIHLLAVNGDKEKLQEALQSSRWDINEVDQLSRTPLIYAVLGDRLECVAYLLKFGADINVPDIDERTALHWAAYQGNHKLVKLLLSKGADKVKRDKEGRTPLHLATSHDNIKVMHTLLHSMKPRDINRDDNNKLTALCWSVFYDRIAYVRLLLRHGADTNALDNESRSILHWTIQNKDPSILRLLIEHNSKLINFLDSQHRTVLHLAIGRSNIALVEFLLDVSAVNINDKMGRTPLHWAAVLGDTDIVSLLLERGADHTISDNNGVSPLHYAAQTDSHETVLAMLDTKGIKDIPDNESGTALMWAAVKGSSKVLEILLEKKCSDVNAVDANMQTALHKCTQAGYLNCVKILIDHGADVNVYDTKHHSPLFHACASGHRDIVEQLLINGSASCLDDKDSDGKRPIHYAAIRDRTDIIKILLKYHSSVDAQDNDGCTPLHLAAFLGFVHCISVLLENKANVELKDNVGRTALHLACRSGYVDAVKLLVSRFNAAVNAVALEREPLTPLDYAILEDHQDVAIYLQTENNASTAKTLNMCARKIQTFWRNYCFRKSFKPSFRQISPTKREREHKNIFSSYNNNNNNNNVIALTLNANNSTVNSRASRYSLSSHFNFTSPFTPESKVDKTIQQVPKVRSDIRQQASDMGVSSSNTISSNSSSVFAHHKSRRCGNISKPKLSTNTSNSVFNKEVGVDGSTMNSFKSYKHVKGVRKVSTTANRQFQEHLASKRTHRNSTNSARYHQVDSSVSSTSSSDKLTNSMNKRNAEDHNLSKKQSFTMYNDNVKSSSSDSSIVFQPKEGEGEALETITKDHAVPTPTTTETSTCQNDTPTIRIIQPDYEHNKPWNIYRRDQKRIQIIRQQTNAAVKIQTAFRRYRSKKYYSANKANVIIRSDGNLKDGNISLDQIHVEQKNITEDGKLFSLTEVNSEVLEGTEPSTEETSEPSTEGTSEPSTEGISEPSTEGCSEPRTEENSEPSTLDSSPAEENLIDESGLQEVAALIIQLAWRQYTKTKLLHEQSLPVEISSDQIVPVCTSNAGPVTMVTQISVPTHVLSCENEKIEKYCSENASRKKLITNKEMATHPSSLQRAQEVYCPSKTNIPGNNLPNNGNNNNNNTIPMVSGTVPMVSGTRHCKLTADDTSCSKLKPSSSSQSNGLKYVSCKPSSGKKDGHGTRRTKVK